MKPWVWAEDKNEDEWLRFNWYRPCKVCLPDLVRRREVLHAQIAAQRAAR